MVSLRNGNKLRFERTLGVVSRNSRRMANDSSGFVGLAQCHGLGALCSRRFSEANPEIQGLALPGLPWATSVSKESCLLPCDSYSPVVSIVATNNEA